MIKGCEKLKSMSGAPKGKGKGRGRPAKATSGSITDKEGAGKQQKKLFDIDSGAGKFT